MIPSYHLRVSTAEWFIIAQFPTTARRFCTAHNVYSASKNVRDLWSGLTPFSGSSSQDLEEYVDSCCCLGLCIHIQPIYNPYTTHIQPIYNPYNVSCFEVSELALSPLLLIDSQASTCRGFISHLLGSQFSWNLSSTWMARIQECHVPKFSKDDVKGRGKELRIGIRWVKIPTTLGWLMSSVTMLRNCVLKFVTWCDASSNDLWPLVWIFWTITSIPKREECKKILIDLDKHKPARSIKKWWELVYQTQGHLWNSDEFRPRIIFSERG